MSSEWQPQLYCCSCHSIDDEPYKRNFLFDEWEFHRTGSVVLVNSKGLWLFDRMKLVRRELMNKMTTREQNISQFRSETVSVHRPASYRVSWKLYSWKLVIGTAADGWWWDAACSYGVMCETACHTPGCNACRTCMFGRLPPVLFLFYSMPRGRRLESLYAQLS